MAAVERANLIVRPFNASLWKHRKMLLYLVMVLSSLLSLMYSPASRQYALIACQFFLRTVVPQLSKVLGHLLAPPYLYILLNLVIVTIAVTSGIPNQKHADPRMDSMLKQDAERIHPITLPEPSTAEFDIEKSEKPLYSSPRKQGYPVSELERSEPIPSNPSTGMPEEAGLEDQSYRRPPCAIAIQENVLYFSHEGKSAPASHHIVVEDPMAKADAHVPLVQVDESNFCHSGIQPLQIEEDEGHCELSTEELKAKADAFIVKIRNHLKLERQDSLRRNRGSGLFA